MHATKTAKFHFNRIIYNVMKLKPRQAYAKERIKNLHFITSSRSRFLLGTLSNHDGNANENVA